MSCLITPAGCPWQENMLGNSQPDCLEMRKTTAAHRPEAARPARPARSRSEMVPPFRYSRSEPRGGPPPPSPAESDAGAALSPAKPKPGPSKRPCEAGSKSLPLSSSNLDKPTPSSFSHGSSCSGLRDPAAVWTHRAALSESPAT